MWAPKALGIGGAACVLALSVASLLSSGSKAGSWDPLVSLSPQIELQGDRALSGPIWSYRAPPHPGGGALRIQNCEGCLNTPVYLFSCLVTWEPPVRTSRATDHKSPGSPLRCFSGCRDPAGTHFSNELDLWFAYLFIFLPIIPGSVLSPPFVS